MSRRDEEKRAGFFCAKAIPLIFRAAVGEAHKSCDAICNFLHKNRGVQLFPATFNLAYNPV